MVGSSNLCWLVIMAQFEVIWLQTWVRPYILAQAVHDCAPCFFSWVHAPSSGGVHKLLLTGVSRGQECLKPLQWFF
jgi:hypothetical protein